MPPLEPALEALYAELRSLADGLMRRERPGHTLQPTALVHEAYLKLAGRPELQYSSRKEFFSLAATVMRQVLADDARSKGRIKRGKDPWQVTFTEGLLVGHADAVDAIAFHDALDRLGELDPQALQIIELRYIAGFSVDETADTIGISAPTVKRDTATARAWLLRQLGRVGPSAPVAHE